MDKFYMHTFDGKPAYFDGRQIVFANNYGRRNILATSLTQIKQEQVQTKKFRLGIPLKLGEYDSIRVYAASD